MEKKTVHEALAELKVLNKRIYDKINTFEACVANRASNKKISGVDISDWKKDGRAAYKSILDLIDRRNRIKKAVVTSNASTTVKIAGKELTVAEAIDMKQCGMEFKVSLYSAIRGQYDKAVSNCNLGNADLEERAEDYVAKMFNGGDRKIDNEQTKAQRKDFIENNEYKVEEVINCKAEINKLEEEIDAFVSEVDAALSVSNAVTFIEF